MVHARFTTSSRSTRFYQHPIDALMWSDPTTSLLFITCNYTQNSIIAWVEIITDNHIPTTVFFCPGETEADDYSGTWNRFYMKYEKPCGISRY